MSGIQQSTRLLKYEMILNEAGLYILSSQYEKAQSTLQKLLTIDSTYPTANY